MIYDCKKKVYRTIQKPKNSNKWINFDDKYWETDLFFVAKLMTLACLFTKYFFFVVI